MNDKDYELIVIVVKKGKSEKVVEAAKSVGAEGSTVVNGRGSSVHETSKIFGMVVEPEKEIILIVVERSITNIVLNKIVEEANLNKPGEGIGFVLEVEKVVGMHVSDK